MARRFLAGGAVPDPPAAARPRLEPRRAWPRRRAGIPAVGRAYRRAGRRRPTGSPRARLPARAGGALPPPRRGCSPPAPARGRPRRRLRRPRRRRVARARARDHARQPARHLRRRRARRGACGARCSRSPPCRAAPCRWRSSRAMPPAARRCVLGDRLERLPAAGGHRRGGGGRAGAWRPRLRAGAPGRPRSRRRPRAARRRGGRRRRSAWDRLRPDARWFERRLGGYTGDCLGAVQQASEVGFYLGVLACL